MPIYQNVGIKPGAAEFADPSNPVGPNVLVFRSAINRVNTKVGQEAFSKMEVSLTRPFATQCPDTCASIVLNESVKLVINVRQGVDPAELREELNRVTDKAIADYALRSGLVPPASASFSE